MLKSLSIVRFATSLAFSVALCLAACGVYAQTARSGGGGNAQLMQQMQQLASERTQLQAENARLKKELADVTKDRDGLKNGREALNRRATSSEGAIARVAEEKKLAQAETEKTKERMQELIAKFRETVQTLKDVETERSTFKQSLVARDAELGRCVAKNDALFKLNQEILARMDGQGAFARLASAEPFTKLKRVQLQNLVDEYRYKAEDQRVQASESSSVPASQ